MEVYAVCANFTDGCTYYCTEVQQVFADKDIAEYIVDAANEKVNHKDESATTYVMLEFEVQENMSIQQADEIVQSLLKEHN